jgi:hypothetical protein
LPINAILGETITHVCCRGEVTMRGRRALDAEVMHLGYVDLRFRADE